LAKNRKIIFAKVDYGDGDEAILEEIIKRDL